MDSPKTEQQTALRGNDASLVLENPAYAEAIAMLKAQVVTQIEDCPIRDTEGQLLLVQLLKMANKFEGLMAGMVERGKMANVRIEIDEMRKESGARRMLRKVTG